MRASGRTSRRDRSARGRSEIRGPPDAQPCQPIVKRWPRRFSPIYRVTFLIGGLQELAAVHRHPEAHHVGRSGAGYGLGWDLETVTLAGKQTRIGHNGDSLGGMVASLMTFPEYGMAGAVTSNISSADTFSLAVKIAEAFAQPARR